MRLLLRLLPGMQERRQIQRQLHLTLHTSGSVVPALLTDVLQGQFLSWLSRIVDCVLTVYVLQGQFLSWLARTHNGGAASDASAVAGARDPWAKQRRVGSTPAAAGDGSELLQPLLPRAGSGAAALELEGPAPSRGAAAAEAGEQLQRGVSFSADTVSPGAAAAAEAGEQLHRRVPSSGAAAADEGPSSEAGQQLWAGPPPVSFEPLFRPIRWVGRGMLGALQPACLSLTVCACMASACLTLMPRAAIAATKCDPEHAQQESVAFQGTGAGGCMLARERV
jgi:hypothetical protein